MKIPIKKIVLNQPLRIIVKNTYHELLPVIYHFPVISI